MDQQQQRESVFRRSPSLSASPPPTSRPSSRGTRRRSPPSSSSTGRCTSGTTCTTGSHNNSTGTNSGATTISSSNRRLSPLSRGTSLQLMTVPLSTTVPWSKTSHFRRSYSHDLDDVVMALLSSSSSGSSSAGTPTSVGGGPRSVMTVPSGDAEEMFPATTTTTRRSVDETRSSSPSNNNNAIPRGSMRKRLPSNRNSPPPSSNNSGSPPSGLCRDESVSFRRKKKQPKPSPLKFWRSRNALKRVLVIIGMLFVLSFSMAYLSARNGRQERNSSTTTSSSSRQQQRRAATGTIPKTADSHNLDGTTLLSHMESLWSSLAGQSMYLFSSSSSTDHNNNNSTNAPTGMFHPFFFSTTSRRMMTLRGSKMVRPDDSQQVVVPEFRRTTPGAPSCALPLRPDEVEFTVVTQLSMNRLWMMDHHCERWNGSFSIAVYSDDGSATVASVQDELLKMNCAVDQIAVHVITGYSEEEYPVNVLRNAALSSVTTSHMIYVDIDFWPSTDLRQTLQHHIDRLASDAKAALVMPAFQLNRQCRDYRECPEDNVPMMPRDKDDLLTLMIDKKQGNAFDPLNRGGHGSTLYRDWFDQEADQLLPISCVNSNRYEPYLIVRYCDALPPFQEVFTGYGKNKMTWVMQLRREGYKLLQLGQSFVVHYPHLDSKARMRWNGGKNGRQLRKPQLKKKDPSSSYLDYKRGQIDHTFLDFRTWLEANVPDQTYVPKCLDAFNDDEKLWTNG